jgi:hypothetical protein
MVTDWNSMSAALSEMVVAGALEGRSFQVWRKRERVVFGADGLRQALSACGSDGNGETGEQACNDCGPRQTVSGHEMPRRLSGAGIGSCGDGGEWDHLCCDRTNAASTHR